MFMSALMVIYLDQDLVSPDVAAAPILQPDPSAPWAAGICAGLFFGGGGVNEKCDSGEQEHPGQ